MFSPSQLLQAMGQRSAVSMPKPVELAPGQVFKGTVIKQYPDNMALVQIGGMQVQAKMEANLEPGQKAWLQVQPSSDVVTFKVLDAPSSAGGQDTSMESLIRSLGLPDTKENRAIAQALLNASMPVSKETVQAFTNIAQQLGMNDSTVEAFLLAVKRNLPLTPDTISGLKAFLSEKPLGQLIQGFLEQAAQFLDDGQGLANQTAGTDMRQVVRQLQDKLAALPVMVTEKDQSEPSSIANGTGARLPNMPTDGEAAIYTKGTPPQSMSKAEPDITQTTGARLPNMPTDEGAAMKPEGMAPQTSGQPAAALTERQGSQQQGIAVPLQTSGDSAGNEMSLQPKQLNGSQPVNQVDPHQGDSVPQLAKPVNGNTALEASQRNPASMMPPPENMGKAPASPSSAAIATTGNADTPSGLEVATPRLTDRSTSELQRQAPNVQPAASQETSTQPPVRTHPIMELFRQMGIAHERDLMGHALSGGAMDAGLQKQMETVKSLLLQISQSPAHAVPAALRESADQLLQQVTGQQLMMVQNSSQALSQLVMQIPIRTGDGEDTAYVQIESKKKGNGEVDAENCRLFFHLELQTVGTTMIDVSIVKRIVNVQIFNDTPWIEALAHGMRDDFSKQMQDAGYHLSAMRIVPIPEQRSNISATASTKEALLSAYKGVDLRI